MDVLRCKSRSMIDKEIAVCLLAYNLVRQAMAKAASLVDVLPRVLSFTGAKRLLSAFADQLRRTSGDEVHTLIATVLRSIATLRLPQRPDRIEPRAKKRRPKKLPGIWGHPGIWGQVFYYHILKNIRNNINIKCDNKRPDPCLLVANHFVVHYTTVSRLVKKYEAG